MFSLSNLLTYFDASAADEFKRNIGAKGEIGYYKKLFYFVV